MRQLRPELSPALSRLIQKMMAKSPAARFVDYEHLIQALDALPVSTADPDGDPQLVPLDEEVDAASPWLRPGDSSLAGRAVTVEMRQAPAPEPPAPPSSPETSAPLLREILEEEPAEVVRPLPSSSFVARRNRGPDTHHYIVRGVLIGLAIALSALGVRQVIVALKPPPASNRAADEPNGARVALPEKDASPDDHVAIPGEGPSEP